VRIFDLMLSGDFVDAQGNTVGDLALDLLAAAPHVKWGFLEDQKPRADDPGYQDRLYSMAITPEHVAAANGIVICRPWIKASAFSTGAEKLVAIGRAGIGYDKIDLAACTANDVIVFNSPHGLTHSTASAALLLMLALARRLQLQQRMVREYRWDLQKDAIGEDLGGHTLGIVGLGQTGMELARLVVPFGMRILAYSPHADPAKARSLDVRLVSSLDDLLRESDYLSLHCRLTERTRGMIGQRELGLMKPSAYFINVARGELVDQQALVRCLQEGRIRGAGLDVFDTEPLPLDDPLLALDNVVLTPHWLASTRQAGRATMAAVIDGILRVARGELPDNILNPDVIDRPGFRAKLQRYRPVT
jgi:phosphoglycerate dehydrogenase-like enzyme